jgi:Uncharacterized protein conserved in bacteria (DUF2252)
MASFGLSTNHRLWYLLVNCPWMLKGGCRPRTLDGERHRPIHPEPAIRSATPDSAIQIRRYGRKVVGVGSVGTCAWIVLLSGSDDQDPQILQAKEANASVLEAYTSPCSFDTHGQRVVEGQRLIQAYGDALLRWHYWPDSPRRITTYASCATGKGSLEIGALAPDAPAAYAKYCAWTVARAQPDPETGLRSRPISEARTYSIKPMLTFQSPTPIRTSEILPVSKRLLLRDKSLCTWIIIAANQSSGSAVT